MESFNLNFEKIKQAKSTGVFITLLKNSEFSKILIA